MRTTNSKIKASLRQLWLRSKERSEALKREQYCCERCHVKQSKKKGFEVKVEVHHKKGILNWEQVLDLIKEQLLCDPILLEVLCKDCHNKITYSE